jgi:hypothetical protein
MILVYVCVTWIIVEIKTRFETWITWNDVNGLRFVPPFLFNNTYCLPVLTKDTKYTNQVFYAWLVYLKTINRIYVIETWYSPNDGIRKCLLDMKRGSNKNTFWEVGNKKWRKWLKFESPFLFNNTYGLPVLTMDTKCPNQLFYEWLVLNRVWKRVCLQIITFVYVCSSLSIAELNTRFETWITRNDVNGVSLFNPSYLITLMV